MNENKVSVELTLVDRGKIKALADVTFATPIGELGILGFRIVQSQDQDPWVALPNVTYEKGGERFSKALLDLTRRTKARLAAAILAEFDRAAKSQRG